MKLAVAVAFLVLSSSAWAATPSASETKKREQARELYRQAQIHYRTGDLEKASAEFKDSYALFPAPETLFNMAQTQRLLKNYEKAVFLYEQYLSTSTATQIDRQPILDRIAELKKVIEEQRRAQTAAPVAVQPDVKSQEARPAATPTHDALAVTSTAPATKKKPIYQQWWLWTAVGAGVGAVAVGLGVGLSHSSTPSATTDGGTIRF
jgi:outer membrane protein assembly factor BamD (BamD/ComL family)